MPTKSSNTHLLPWIILTFLLGATVVILATVVLVGANSTSQEDDQPIPSEMDEEPVQEEEEDMAWESFNNRGIAFDYPNNWHLYGTFNYDAPGDIVPQFDVLLSDDPITIVTPGGGPAIFAPIEIRSFPTGDAYLAPYEGLNWESYELDTIQLNGRDVERLRFTAGDEIGIFASEEQEILFFFHDDISYEVRYVAGDELRDVWEQIKASLRFSNNTNAGTVLE